MKSTALAKELRITERLLAGFQCITHREVTEVLDDVRRLPLEVPRVRLLKLSFALVFLLSLLPIVGAAFQTPALTETGSIKGSLLDASGAVIPAVAVTLTNSSGTAQETTADENGEFSFAGLAPGIYTV